MSLLYTDLPMPLSPEKWVRGPMRRITSFYPMTSTTLLGIGRDAKRIVKAIALRTQLRGISV